VRRELRQHQTGRLAHEHQAGGVVARRLVFAELEVQADGLDQRRGVARPAREEQQLLPAVAAGGELVVDALARPLGRDTAVERQGEDVERAVRRQVATSRSAAGTGYWQLQRALVSCSGSPSLPAANGARNRTPLSLPSVSPSRLVSFRNCVK
jgi:hypothetical protein